MDTWFMKLSIIIPAYNVTPYIEKCVRSCEMQDIKKDEYEVIIVDDGSTDNTKECVKLLQKEFSNIKYIFQENARQGAARNNGLRNANGEYIWYVDADDWIEENCIGEILNRIEKNALTALAVRHAKYYGEKLKLWPALDESKVKTGKEVLIDHDLLVSPTYCIWNRDYLLRNNLFFVEGIFHEDTEIFPRLFYKAENRVCYYIYESDNSTTRSRNPQRAMDVVEVVQYLTSFCDGIDNLRIQKAIRRYICSTINMSLFNTYQLNKNDNKKLNQYWADNKHLFDNLVKCDIWKYRIEGFLFKMFPTHVTQIYQLMQKGNSDPGKMKKQKA